jgi:hypothetical protein
MPTVSREELCKQVWERPLMKVAAYYNITGTGLKKKSERHETHHQLPALPGVP